MGYNDQLGMSQAPGYGPEVSSEDRGILLQPCATAYDSKWLKSDTVDNENTSKTTRLRPGLVLVPNIARTYYVNPEHADAMDASDLLPGDPVVLSEYRETKDGAGVAQDITAKVLTLGTVISERLLFGSGTSADDAALIKAAMSRILVVPGHEPL